MIRRLFWLILGAATGIAGYRRGQALVRRVNRPALVSAVRQTSRFAHDVREGMDDYFVRHPRHAGSTLQETTEREGN